MRAPIYRSECVRSSSTFVVRPGKAGEVGGGSLELPAILWRLIIVSALVHDE